MVVMVVMVKMELTNSISSDTWSSLSSLFSKAILAW